MSTMFTAWRLSPYQDCSYSVYTCLLSQLCPIKPISLFICLRQPHSLVQIYSTTPPLNSPVYHKHAGLLGAVASPSVSSDHLTPAFLYVCVCPVSIPLWPQSGQVPRAVQNLTMQNYSTFKNRTKMNAAVIAGPPATKGAAPTLQSWGRTLASVTASKCWSHACPRIGKYRPTKSLLLNRKQI